MVCSHLPTAPTSANNLRNGVFKDECTQCFVDQDSVAGINVCLTCFNGACVDNGHSKAHFNNWNHPLNLNIRRVPKPKKDGEQPPPLKKVAIQAEPSEAEQFDFITSVRCFHCGEVDVNASPNLSGLVGAVLAATSSQKRSDIQAWENIIFECEHAKNLVPGNPVFLDHEPSSYISSAHCTSCELNNNLWLCLTCGNLGCGRQQYGGGGGNGHGMAHYDATQHPVCVKMGTITPEGTADVYCYQCDNEVLDGQLAAHLRNFGILVESAVLTEKTLTELQLEQNMKFDFSMTTEDGKELAPLFGPGHTGLKNLGNTCYMASVVQVLFALPSFQDRYLSPGQHHLSICKDTPPTCFHCQMAKLAHGLLSGSFSATGQDGISPAMFKTLTSKGHAEFATMRQQDAQEYLGHILKLVEQRERASGRDPGKVFKFAMEQRLQCVQCNCVRYVREPATEAVQVPVPAVETDDETVHVGFDKCLGRLFGEERRDFMCPKCKKTTELTCTTRFNSFPEVLVMPMSRFIQGSDYIMKKLNVMIDAPFELDLSAYKSTGFRDGEEMFPEEGAAAPAAPTVDEDALAQLLGMGFPETRCRKALVKTGNCGAETAMNWLFEHMEDPDIDDPIELTASSGGAPAEDNTDYTFFVDMGFSIAQAKKAMSQTGNNMERAVDWLFSHADDMALDEAPSAPAGGSMSATETPSANPKYELMAFISHRGTSAHCGHYVAHVKKDGKWILFNDNKVAEVPDVRKAVGEAYIYFYKSV
ncbi:hypothetical protein BC830DRAFT_1187292 [Chytriomyces sp. MP71]|nr:hypothetical protein BC830DRAFT_1187292 [Chytriomyces sp. MP71]